MLQARIWYAAQMHWNLHQKYSFESMNAKLQFPRKRSNHVFLQFKGILIVRMTIFVADSK